MQSLLQTDSTPNNRRHSRKGGCLGRPVGHGVAGSVGTVLGAAGRACPPDQFRFKVTNQNTPKPRISNSQIDLRQLQQAMYAPFSLGNYRRLGLGSCAVSITGDRLLQSNGAISRTHFQSKISNRQTHTESRGSAADYCSRIVVPTVTWRSVVTDSCSNPPCTVCWRLAISYRTSLNMCWQPARG